jgi:hypothetical protein
MRIEDEIKSDKSLYASYEAYDFCRVTARPNAAIRTVAALRQSQPFRHGPVVLRFANRLRPDSTFTAIVPLQRSIRPSRAEKGAAFEVRTFYGPIS